MKGFLLSKENGKIKCKNLGNYEHRNESTFSVILLANEKFNIPDFDEVFINTDDFSIQDYELSYSTHNEKYANVIPDFTFDCWREVGISEYTQVTRAMSTLGDDPPETNLLGWRGALTHPNRRLLFNFTDPELYDIQEIVWDRTDPQKLTCSNYVSLEESVKKWRYLIDVEGRGWSARIKFMLFSKRCLFIQDRPHKEWFWPLLKPWIHYVPVSRDLSDLEAKLLYMKQNPDIEDKIRMNAHEFAVNNLSLDKALERWRDVLTSLKTTGSV